MIYLLVVVPILLIGFRRFARALILFCLIGGALFYLVGQAAIGHGPQITAQLAKTDPEKAKAFSDLERMNAERDAR